MTVISPTTVSIANNDPNQFTVVQTTKELRQKLVPGQSVELKVIRHHDQGRYTVIIENIEHTVSSSSRLTVGANIHGRVLEVGDKIHLQRIFSADEQVAGPDKNSVGMLNERLPTEQQSIEALLLHHNVRFTGTELTQLMALNKSVGDTRLVGYGAVALSKLGLPLKPALVHAISDFVASTPKSNAGYTTSVDTILQGAARSLAAEPSLVRQMAKLVEKMSSSLSFMEEPLEPGTPEDRTTGDAQNHTPDREAGAGRHQQRWILGERLLNTQTNSSVAHRFLRIPVWLDDRLIEVTMALYSQHESDRHRQADKKSAIVYRKVIFNIATDSFGQVDVELSVANRNLRINIGTENEQVAEHFGSELSNLRGQLEKYKWKLDEIRYCTRDSISGAAYSVLEHHVKQDSFSRLM